MLPQVIQSSDSDVAFRILSVARAQFFSRGYSGLTMSSLATKLGMSKKTLYVHFRDKGSLVGAIIVEFVNEVCNYAESLFSDPEQDFSVKLLRFCEFIARRFGQRNLHVFRDLQRTAPHIYRHIERLRHRDIPLILGRRLRQGQAVGFVRPDIDCEIAVEYWCCSVLAWLNPECLDRLNLDPDQALSAASKIFLGGILDPVCKVPGV